MKFIALMSVFLMVVQSSASAQFSSNGQRTWTVTEVKTWAEQNKNYSTWKGWLLYQGSDTASHYYIARIMDEWMWFRISRQELKVQDERVYKRMSSSTSLGFYYVDPFKNFHKARDY